MDLLSTIRKEGSRGGVNFSWDDVQNSAHRQNYLGHSLMAPVGRWQKNRDLNWYAKGDDKTGDDGETAEERKIRERKEEIRRIKEAEEDALNKALGLPPVDRGTGTGANGIVVEGGGKMGPVSGEEEENLMPKVDDGVEKMRKVREGRSRSRERKHRRHRHRSRSGERRRHRSRSADRQRHRRQDEDREPRNRSRSGERREQRTRRSRSPEGRKYTREDRSFRENRRDTRRDAERRERLPRSRSPRRCDRGDDVDLRERLPRSRSPGYRDHGQRGR